MINLTGVTLGHVIIMEPNGWTTLSQRSTGKLADRQLIVYGRLHAWFGCMIRITGHISTHSVITSISSIIPQGIALRRKMLVTLLRNRLSVRGCVSMCVSFDLIRGPWITPFNGSSGGLKIEGTNSVAWTTCVHDSVFTFLSFTDPTDLAWPPGQTVSIFVLASRPVVNFKVILTENLKPSPGLTLKMFEIHKPLQLAVIRPDDTVPSTEVVMKVFYCFNDSKQFSTCHTVLLLWPS